MTPDILFSIVNSVALVGWIILAIGIVLNCSVFSSVLAGQAWPFALSALYTILIAAFFFKAEGGFDTLAHVQQLFTSPWVALAGWVHYLAFDLFIGAVIAQGVRQQGLSRLFLIILLPVTFLFGPIGYFLFSILKIALSSKDVKA